MSLIPMSRREVFEELFRYSKTDSLIAYGNIRPDKKGTPGLRPLLACSPATASRTADTLEATGINPSHIRWNLYGIGILPKDEQQDVSEALQRRLSALVDGGDPKHLFTQAYRLVELVALNVDLDVGTRKDGTKFVTAGMALEIVTKLVHFGKLPAPSMVGFSGQGLYILYVLTACKTGKNHHPISATPEARKAYQEAAEAVIGRCIRISRRFIPDGYPPTLNPDMTSKSPVQSFKTPDSRHPKTGEQIRYYRFAIDGRDIELRRYTLEELKRWKIVKKTAKTLANTSKASWYGSGRLNKLFDEQLQHKRKYTPKAGQEAVPMLRRMEDLERLAIHRGQIPEGKRSLWAMIIFNTLRDLFIRREHKGDHDSARAAAIAGTISFNTKCFNPPLSIQDILNESTRRRDFKNTTLVNLLCVDYTEAVKAGLRFIVPEKRRMEIEEEERRRRKLDSAATKKSIRNEQMIQDFRSGMTVKAVTMKYGLAESRVWQLKREFKNKGLMVNTHNNDTQIHHHHSISSQ